MKQYYPSFAKLKRLEIKPVQTAKLSPKKTKPVEVEKPIAISRFQNLNLEDEEDKVIENKKIFISLKSFGPNNSLNSIVY